MRLCQTALNVIIFHMYNLPTVNTTKSKSEEPCKPVSNFWGEIIQFILIIIFVVIPFRAFVAQPFVVSGDSMQPTFETGDYLVVDQLSYKFSNPNRGDVIVFKYPNDPSKYFIKRIIGLPGETVTVKNEKVYITSAGETEAILIEEPYIKDFRPDNMSIIVDEGKYFVMGDNRLVSSDSRVWGLLDEKFIKGRAFVRLFPFFDISIFPGGYGDYKTKLE